MSDDKAFPESYGDPRNQGWIGGGMTLRDYFAAKALDAAVNANWRDIDYVPQDGLSLIGNAARLAYQLADAMLEQRCNPANSSAPKASRKGA